MNNKDIEAMDLLNVASFLAQVSNMSQDEEQTAYINLVIKAIAIEIEKLHKENDIIIQQNQKIINLLRGGIDDRT